MLFGPLTHPGLIGALAAAGHGSKVLLADGNYPCGTGVGARTTRIDLNLAPGLLTVSDVVRVLRQAVPIEAAGLMVPAPDAEPVAIPAHEEYRSLLPGVPFEEISRFDFYDVARGQDVAIVVATGDQRLYANLLLTIGVRQPD